MNPFGSFPTFALLPDPSQFPDGLTVKTQGGAYTLGEDLQGVPGAQFLQGSGVPDAGLGNDGDSYLDLNTGVLYAKASGAWASQIDLIDTTGGPIPTDNVISGTAVPTSADGVDGQFYIRYVNNRPYSVYGPKTAGSWGRATSLVALTVKDVGSDPAGLKVTYSNGSKKTVPVASGSGFTESLYTTTQIRSQLALNDNRTMAGLGLTDADNAISIQIFDGPIANNVLLASATITVFEAPGLPAAFADIGSVMTQLGNRVGQAILGFPAPAGGQDQWDFEHGGKWAAVTPPGKSVRILSGALADALQIVGDHDVRSVSAQFAAHASQVKVEGIDVMPWPATSYVNSILTHDLQTFLQILMPLLGTVLGTSGVNTTPYTLTGSVVGDFLEPDAVYFLRGSPELGQLVLKKLPSIPAGSGKVSLKYDRDTSEFIWE